MDTKELLTIVGWPVSCILSIIAGGWVTPRLIKKRKTLVWAVVSESELIPKELHSSLSLPVSIQVGGVTPKSLSLITIRLGNGGNEVVEKIAPAITFNSAASALYVKPQEDLGEFQKCVEGVIESDRVRVAFSHINPGDDYEFELLLSDYELGSIGVDLAAAGVDVVRRDASRWELPVSTLRGIGLSFFGVRYAPEVAIMATIATELKAMRRMFQQREKDG